MFSHHPRGSRPHAALSHQAPPQTLLFSSSFSTLFFPPFASQNGAKMRGKIGPKSSKILPRILLFGSLVFDTLPVSKISRFKGLGTSKMCFSLKRGAQIPIFVVFSFFSKKSHFELPKIVIFDHFWHPNRARTPLFSV